MKKKMLWSLVALCFVSILAYGTWTRRYYFLDRDGTGNVDCAAGDTIVNGTDFNSLPIDVKKPTDRPMGGITIEFIPESAESEDTIDFDFEVSTDDGITWALYREEFETPLISIPLATPTVDSETGLVRIAVSINLGGMSHIRWREATNNDDANYVDDIRIWISL